MTILLVYSGNIKWMPIGGQADLYSHGEEQFGMIEDNILLCKMRPRQEIHAFMHAVKGIGKDHAKFSPVGKFQVKLIINLFVAYLILIL